MAKAEQRLDIFPHIFPREFFDRMKGIAEQKPALAANIKRWLNIPVLWDLDRRIRMMKKWPGYQQVLTLSLPAIEFLADERDSPALARLANDGMAEIVEKHRDLCPCFVASLPLNNVPAALDEMDRAIGELGAKGIQIFTNMNGRPMDDPEFFPIFERMSKKYDLPIWVHPVRTAKFADYPGEAKSKYEMWWLFGWPYETSVFMGRLVFSGMFDRLPKLKIITHHLGAMVPFLANRVGYGMDQFGSRTADEDYEGLLKKMGARPVEFFRKFYNDTSINGWASGIRCGLDFFGVDRVLFASDAPFDPEKGPMYIRETIAIVDRLPVSAGEREQIYWRNAKALLKLS
jgi:predicted TIM-barrel fold metal-dependent hydrolase